jgi:SAM-dependent methyltransferase
MSPQSGAAAPDPAVVWHDIECGAYRADLPLWRELAETYGSPILDVGAGTGRVTLDLAQAGWELTAIDRDPRLLDELARRAEGLPVITAAADAREFDLARQFALILVPMQTVQLLGGSSGRHRFLSRARAHLRPGGLLAVAVTERFDIYAPGPGQPELLPDVGRRGATVYASRPTAVRPAGNAVVLERRREMITGDGRSVVEPDMIRVDRLSADQLERQAEACDLNPVARRTIGATENHVGSVVVILGG